VQRLFSTFANGWPGRGLLVLRLVTSLAVLHFAIVSQLEGPPLKIVIQQIIAVIAGVLILVGLWTPLAGALAMIVNLWIALTRYSSHSGDPSIPMLEAALGAALAMIGPGAWSIDARLFGRKHIDLPDDE
jgi:putative oxidoreductase